MLVCQKCGVEIRMLEHHRTKNPAPIEAEASADGNIQTVGPVYLVVPKDQRATLQARGVRLYKNHFATCAFAKSFARATTQRKETQL